MRTPRAFSLVELLVAIAIIGTLLALLLPAVHAAWGAARRARCAHNLRQTALATHAYHGVHRCYPPGLNQFAFPSPPKYRGTSLFVFLLPYVEEKAVCDGWDYDHPLKNTEGGLAAAPATVISMWVCPASQIARNPIEKAGAFYGLTSYGGNGGTRSYCPNLATTDGIFHTTGPASLPKPDQRPVRMEMVRDGTSQTLFFGERSRCDPNFETFAAANWTQSLQHLGTWAAIGGRKRIGDVTMSSHAPINYRLPFNLAQKAMADPPLKSSWDFSYYEDLRVCAWGSDHPGGANFAFVDGSVSFLSEDLPSATLRALSTRGGGELEKP